MSKTITICVSLTMQTEIRHDDNCAETIIAIKNWIQEYYKDKRLPARDEVDGLETDLRVIFCDNDD